VLNWRTASGQLKDMSALLLLAKLAEGVCSSCRCGNAGADVKSCVYCNSPICSGLLQKSKNRFGGSAARASEVIRQARALHPQAGEGFLNEVAAMLRAAPFHPR
jgi:hypothetical protein